jgi:regulator of replication initiation timing
MTENKQQQITNEIGLLNVRINDLMTQLNTTIKTLMDENATLQKEINDLKAKQEKQTTATNNKL